MHNFFCARKHFNDNLVFILRPGLVKKIVTGSVTIVAALLLSACAQSSKLASADSGSATSLPSLAHAYDYRLFDSATQQIITLPQLAKQLQSVDVVFIGEFHGSHASHLLQMQLMAELHRLRPKQVLSLEMFNRDQQPILNRYLDSEIGETFLIKEAPAWENYAASYRPLVEFAKQNFTPVIAANAAADLVRCVGREGASYLDKLTDEERRWIARDPFIDQADYRQKYMAFLEDARALTDERKERSYMAQLTRDNTMAESINQAWSEYSGAQIIHLNGSFHSERHLGTVGALKRLNPALKVAVITPVQIKDPSQPISPDEALGAGLEKTLQKGDYIYLLSPQPVPFRDSAYKGQVRQKMFQRSEESSCR